MITVSHLTKVYGDVRAVDDLSFQVRPGIVTGFLGPNGAGKSTTMRLVMGLDAPTSGTATVNGRPLVDHDAPLTEIGALLDARAFDPRRSARSHLSALAATTGIDPHRVDEMLDLVGLTEVANKPAGGFSLGMGQRLGIAAAMLGDPATLMLDEPVNGLDPDGIVWMRGLLRQLAAEGRTVFLSSHLMSEMSQIADHYVIIGRGELIVDVSAVQLAEMSGTAQVIVRTTDISKLASVLSRDGVTIRPEPDNTLVVTGLSPLEIGRRALEAHVVLFELTPRSSSLEETFMRLTHDAVDYHTTAKAA